MKSKWFYLFIVILLSLVFFEWEVDAKDVSINLIKGEEKIFASEIEYNDVDCLGIDKLKYFDVEKNSNGDYIVSIKDNVTYVDSEVLTCEYKKSTNGFRSYGDNTLKYIFSYNNSKYNYSYVDLTFNEKYSFEVQNVSFDSCYSLSDEVFAKLNGKVCDVVVNSDINQTVEVIATANNIPYVLKVNVVAEKKDNELINLQYSNNNSSNTNSSSKISYPGNNSSCQVDAGGGKVSSMQIKNKDVTGKVIVSQASSCNVFSLNTSETNGGFLAYMALTKDELNLGGNYWGDGTSSSGVYTYLFTAKELCPDSNKSYAAICLDPGKIAPRNQIYYSSRAIDPSKSDFDKAAYYIASAIKEDTNLGSDIDNVNRIAAEIALRIIAIKENQAGGYVKGDLNHHALYALFKKMADQITGSTTTYEFPKEIQAGENWGAISEQTKVFLNKYLQGFPGVKFPTSEEKDIKMTYIQYEVNGDDNSTTKVGTFTGNLSIPKSIKIQDAEIEEQCAANLECKFDVKNSGEYTLVVTFDEKYEELLEDADNLVVKLSFSDENEVDFGVSLLEPCDTGASLQRMIIFNQSSPEILLKFSTKIAEKECDLSKIDLNNPSSSDLKYIKENNCCEELAAYPDLYQKYCECYLDDYDLYCDPGNSSDVDVYHFKEAYSQGSSRISSCMIDVSWDKDLTKAQKNSQSKVDNKQNSVSVEDYYNNQYCRVSCFDDWDFVTSSFQNFTGANKRLAGNSFIIDNDLFIGTKRTCVTSVIDYKKYYDDVKTLANQMVVKWNAYVEFAHAYDSIVATYGHSPHNSQKSVDCEYTSKEFANPKVVEVCDEVEEWTGGAHEHTSCTWNSETKENDCVVVGECSISYGYTCTHKAKCNVYSIHTHTDVSAGSFTTITPAADRADKGRNEDKTLATYSVTSGYRAKTGKSGCPYSGISSAQDYWCEGDVLDKMTKEQVIEYLLKKKNYSSDNKSYLSVKDHVRSDGREDEGELSEISGNIPERLRALSGEINELKNKLNELVVNMKDCQNFYIYNNYNQIQLDLDYERFNKADKPINYTYKENNKNKMYEAYKTGGVIPELTGSPNEISTIFAPEVYYTYEEPEFMALIGTDNYLIDNLDKDHQFIPKDSNNICQRVLIGHNGTMVNLCKNKITTYTYDIGDGEFWIDDENPKARRYSDGSEKKMDSANDDKDKLETDKSRTDFDICIVTPGDDLGWKATDQKNTVCEEFKLLYYKTNYRKQTLENSTFYVNKGNWFVTHLTDIKIHADNIDAAGGVDKVSAMGDYNVFPISINTKADIYKYVYTFNDIGHFIDFDVGPTGGTGNTELGRVMGGSNPIMPNNEHACFYEVHEKFCKCCGDEIDTSDEPMKEIDTDEVLEEHCKGSGCANSEESTGSTTTSGYLGFFSSSTSLYDLDGVGGNSNYLGENWQMNDNVVYNGDNYETDQGGHLYNYIQGVGEKIYQSSPEYSYYLDPNALNTIKNTGTTDVEIVGIYAFESANNNPRKYSFNLEDVGNKLGISDPETRIPTISHHKSMFLKEVMDEFVTEKYRGTVLKDSMGHDCYVTANDMMNADESAGYLKNKKANCKWIDYVQCSVDSNNSQYKCLRLAFK